MVAKYTSRTDLTIALLTVSFKIFDPITQFSKLFKYLFRSKYTNAMRWFGFSEVYYFTLFTYVNTDVIPKTDSLGIVSKNVNSI